MPTDLKCLLRIYQCSVPFNEGDLSVCHAQVIELSGYLEKRISGSAEDAEKAAAEYSEVGKVVTVGDGIARVYGLNNVQAGEVRLHTSVTNVACASKIMSRTTHSHGPPKFEYRGFEFRRRPSRPCWGASTGLLAGRRDSLGVRLSLSSRRSPLLSFGSIRDCSEMNASLCPIGALAPLAFSGRGHVKMVIFDCGLRGMALNLEESNVGVVIFGDDRYDLCRFRPLILPLIDFSCPPNVACSPYDPTCVLTDRIPGHGTWIQLVNECGSL